MVQVAHVLKACGCVLVLVFHEGFESRGQVRQRRLSVANLAFLLESQPFSAFMSCA